MSRFRFNSCFTFVIFAILHWTSIVIDARGIECKADECWSVSDALVKKHMTGKKRINERCKISRIDGVKDINGMELVIDPCMDEENRNFMECVLDFIEPTTSGEDKTQNGTGDTTERGDVGAARQGSSVGTDEGTCQCYREWSHEATRTPAYNHSLNPAKETHDWFLYNETYGECVVKNRRKCSPTWVKIVPYRCQWAKSSYGVFKEGRCTELDLDPNFKVCSVEGAGGRILPKISKSFHMILIMYFLFVF